MTFNLSTIQQGQIANLSGSFYEILKALLKWRNDSYRSQENYAENSFHAAEDIATNTMHSIEDEADKMQAEGIAAFVGGGAALLATGYGLRSSMTAGRDLESLQSNLEQSRFDSMGAEERSETTSNNLLDNDPREQMERKSFFKSGRYKNFEESEIQNAYETLGPQQTLFDERLSEALQQEQSRGMRNSNAASAMAGGFSTAIQGTGSVVASYAKRAQAEAEFAKTLANYLSQVAQIINSMLASLTSQATNATDNLFQTEGTIAAATTYRG